MHNEPENTRLRDTVLSLVQNRPVHQTLKQISADTGLQLGWLKLFAQNKISNPSCNRVEKLYEYMTGKPLEL